MAMWLVSQVELDEPRCQIGNMRCIGPPEKKISLHPDEKGQLHPWLLGWCETEEEATTSHPQRSNLHVIEQHELRRVRMQVPLLVYPRCSRHRHPIGHRIAVQVMLEPVRSYASGTIRGSSPCR